MLGLLIQLLILVVIAGIVWWVIGQIPLPQPLRLVVIVIFAIIAIIVLCSIAGWVGPLGPIGGKRWAG